MVIDVNQLISVPDIVAAESLVDSNTLLVIFSTTGRLCSSQQGYLKAHEKSRAITFIYIEEVLFRLMKNLG